MNICLRWIPPIPNGDTWQWTEASSQSGALKSLNYMYRQQSKCVVSMLCTCEVLCRVSKQVVCSY